MTRWTKDDVNAVLAKHAAATKPQKFRAEAVVIDNIRFASKKEGKRYVELKMLLAAGKIRELDTHPKFSLIALVMNPRTDDERISGIEVGVYTADFRYECGTETIIEDVKQPHTATTAYKLRKRIAEACHGITITEV